MTIDWSALGTLGFGAGSIGNLYRAIDDDDAADAVRAAWVAGLRHFDTAPHYGFGLSEKRLGAALAELDPGQTAIVSTKVGRRLDSVPPGTDLSAMRQAFVSPEPVESVFDYSHDAVMRSFEASLKRLRRERIIFRRGDRHVLERARRPGWRRFDGRGLGRGDFGRRLAADRRDLHPERAPFRTFGTCRRADRRSDRLRRLARRAVENRGCLEPAMLAARAANRPSVGADRAIGNEVPRAALAAFEDHLSVSPARLPTGRVARF